MTTTPAQPGPPTPIEPGHEDAFDPANQSLADALRKSFGILKLLMLVLVVLYFLSGWFSVKPNETGLILRYGRIVGAAPGQPSSAAILTEGWHWSWPYPFERWITVPTSEREIPVEFMFELSDEEKASGISGYKFNALSPMRDDYLITGDVNILHASLIVKYKITEPADYLTYVYNMPAPNAARSSFPYTRYPEYTILTNLARDAVIETAARQEALVIRGSKQDEFLLAVASRLSAKLKELEQAGAPLGISVDPNTGVLAPKSGGTVEAILPPRQTQQVFDQVFSAQTEKAVAITKAKSLAQERLLQAAGPDYQQLADAIGEEYRLLLKISAAKSMPKAESDSLKAKLASQKTRVESLLEQASGGVQGTIKSAQIARDQLVKEASGDWEQFRSLLPEYLRNPKIFMARLKDETYADALDNDKIAKLYVPKLPDGKIWLKIPRTADQPEAEHKPEEKSLGAGPPLRKRPKLVGP